MTFLLLILLSGTCACLDTCRNYRDNLDAIKSDPKQYLLSTPDTCVLEHLTDIKAEYQKTASIVYLETLALIYGVSDASVTDLLVAIGEDLLIQNFDGFFSYVYDHRNDSNDKSHEWFIEAASTKLAMEADDDRQSKRDELKAFMLNEAQLKKYGKEKIRFLENLEAEFDPGLPD